ncbi:MAG TPA: hypothetical protein VJT08_16015 [Terriglobales bacterium]|nr:hypothetical protein [Acidobacteriaceae bacterium]HKR31988.1 hypothetical protein [Terriglobales bacterium]
MPVNLRGLTVTLVAGDARGHTIAKIIGRTVELRSFEVPIEKKQELLEHLLGAGSGEIPRFRAHEARR